MKLFLGFEGGCGVAVYSYQLGGYALADLGLVTRFANDGKTPVGVNVDESRGHHVAGGIDEPSGLHTADVSTEDVQDVAFDAHCAIVPWIARPIDNSAVKDQ
jgi:hypothetical protein